MSASGIEARALSVAAAGKTVLAGVDACAPRGAFTIVLGPNGAGKSTLLRALAGLIPAAGEVLLDGRSLRRLPLRERARLIAHLPQSAPIHWPVPVRDVVALGRIPHGWGGGRLGGRDAEAVERALQAFDLTDLADRPATALSGGEKQRVALARALAVEAPVLLVDEPAAALDPRHAHALLARLSGLARAGKVVVAVMHDLIAAQSFADRVVLIDSGRVLADGPPEDVLTAARLESVYGVPFSVLKADAVHGESGPASGTEGTETGRRFVLVPATPLRGPSSACRAPASG